MITVYQYLLVPRDVNELIENEYEMKPEEFDPYFRDVIRTSIANIGRYGAYITNVLKEGWSYERLGYIERAILLNGCAEFDLKTIEAAVIIDESVEMAKKYCDEDTYKLINSVLDII
jgi:N utilization substance protein B